MNTGAGESARRLARVAGAFYLMLILIGIPATVVTLGTLEPGDAAATATNLVANEWGVRAAFTLYLLSTAAYVVVTGLFFVLFRPVSPTVAFIAALFSVVGCAVMASSMLFLSAPLLVLGGTHPSALGSQASSDVALLLMQFYIEAFDTSMIFFGFYCVTIGWLVFNSGFLPRLLGVGMALGGVGYLTYLSSPLAHWLFPFNLLPGFAGEAALTLWLLVVGVNAEHGRSRHDRARTSDAPPKRLQGAALPLSLSSGRARWRQ
jgi:hypothetical protein